MAAAMLGLSMWVGAAPSAVAATAKTAQSIAFTSLPPVGAEVGGVSYTVSAIATSSLAVTFSADATSSGICTVSGATVSFVGVGACVIDADQSGDATYQPAPQVQQTVTVGKGGQTIAYTSVPPTGAAVGGASYTVTATATPSGLAVAFSADATSSGICTVSGATVSFVGVGACVIDADQAGNANYQPAPQVKQTVSVARGPTSTAVMSSANPSVYGQAVTFTTTVTGSDSGGTVGFFADGSTTALSGCAAVPLKPVGPALKAACTGPSALPVGHHVIAASYTGDTKYAPSTATLSGGQVVNQAPSITNDPAATFSVGAAGSFPVTATGSPAPTVTETGALPAGVTFNAGTATLAGTPAQGSAGVYPITLNADNGVGTAATQSFTLTVNQATIIYPADGQTNVDTSRAFTWTTIPQAQAYYLIVGTGLYGSDLVNSGVLPTTQTSLNVPALPTGATLYATLLTQVNNTWTYQAITFTAAPGQAAFTSPLNGQTGIDPTAAITWTSYPPAQGYYLIVGTSQYGYDLVNSGTLPASQTSYATPTLPTGKTIYASIFTKVNGAFNRIQSITFTARPAMAVLTLPVTGQTNLATPTAFTWTTIAGAQKYYLVVGTTQYGYDLVNSGVIAPTQSSFNVPALTHGPTLYATLLTMLNGMWVVQAVTFTAA